MKIFIGMGISQGLLAGRVEGAAEKGGADYFGYQKESVGPTAGVLQGFFQEATYRVEIHVPVPLYGFLRDAFYLAKQARVLGAPDSRDGGNHTAPIYQEGLMLLAV